MRIWNTSSIATLLVGDHNMSTVGSSEAIITEYTREQRAHDIALNKLSVKKYEDLFKKGYEHLFRNAQVALCSFLKVNGAPAWMKQKAAPLEAAGASWTYRSKSNHPSEEWFVIYKVGIWWGIWIKSYRFTPLFSKWNRLLEFKEAHLLMLLRNACAKLDGIAVFFYGISRIM